MKGKVYHEITQNKLCIISLQFQFTFQIVCTESEAVNKVISWFVMCSVMRPLGLIIQQTASLRDCRAFTIHAHQMVIICV